MTDCIPAPSSAQGPSKVAPISEASATLADLLAIIEPGETVAYSEVPLRLRRVARPTNGIGRVCAEIAFRGYSGAWRDSEIISWREPYFDDEVEGDWTEGTMYVTRREARS